MDQLSASGKFSLGLNRRRVEWLKTDVAFWTDETGRELFIDNLFVPIHLIIVMIRWTGLAPWEFEFSFSK